MAFPTTHLTLPEQCTQVVLLTTVDAVSATYVSALATSPLVPQNCRVVVWNVPPTATPNSMQEGHSNESSSVPSDAAAAAPPSPTSDRASAATGMGQAAFATALTQIAAKMRERRAPRPVATVTHMTQFFYGGVSPKVEEIGPMMRRIDVRHHPSTDVPAAIAAGVLAVEDSVFVLVLNAQSLGTDTAAALQPYETFLRAVWGVNPHLTVAAPAPRRPPSSSSPPDSVPRKRQGSLVVLADEVYRAAACAMVKTVAAEVSTSVEWFVQLAYVHAMDPPALEFGATEVAVEGPAGISHGGALPVLCATNVLGVLRHFPVSRSEPATITPVDVALNAALLGHIFLRCGELPECSDDFSDLATTGKGHGTRTSAQPTRHHMASFAIAESHKPAEASLVWGMFGEYLMGYYGRFAKHICAAFPVAGVVTPAPILQFPFSLQDVVNFGPEPRCPTYLLEGWRAYQQRQRVTDDFHGAEMTRKMQACVHQLDDTLNSITSAARAAAAQKKAVIAATALRRRASSSSSFALPPYCLDDFNVPVYQYMLRRLTMHYSLMPYHQCVALTEVDWEAYISVIARSVLVHLASSVLQRAQEEPSSQVRRLAGAPGVDIASIAGVKPTAVVADPNSTAPASVVEGALAKPPSDAAATVPFGFPEPRRSFTNDFIYRGEERIPPFPSLTRRYFPCATFLHRTALTSNGWRTDITPGMTPKTMAAILAQPHLQRLMTALAARDGATKAEVEAQAKRILLVAGDTLNHPQCRVMGLTVREIFKCMYQRMSVNHGAFERMHRQLEMPRVAMVYVPLHRSYVDFLSLSLLLAEMQSPLPHIVAGDGFLSLGPLATLMRGSGAFFIRRTFRGDALYTALFKEYVRQLMLSHRPMEFFIEGTRSRTGKTMTPKKGILKFVCDTFFDPSQRELDDVLFIPVSLSYDELLEATMYAKELLGVPKPKENLANFFKASSTLKRVHGSIHLHLGDAISLRSLKEHPRQCPLPYQPKTESIDATQVGQVPSAGGATPAARSTAGTEVRAGDLPSRESLPLHTTPTIIKLDSPTPLSILNSVAWHLTYQLQRNIVITPASMVAALLECLSPYYYTRTPRVEGGGKDAGAVSAGATATTSSSPSTSVATVDAAQSSSEAAGVPLPVMEQGVTWLRGILLERGARLCVEAATWSADRVVKTALGNLCAFAHLTNSMSTVSYQQPDNVVTRLGLNISTNQLIHVCIDEALVAVVAQAFGTPTMPHHPPTAERATVCGTLAVKSDVLANHSQLLQRLLSTEFPNYAASSPVSFASWLECTVSRLQRHQPSAAAVAAAAQRASASAGEAAPPDSHGPFTSLPVTEYYYFLLQLICPHIEALYAVLLTSLTLLNAFPGLPLGAADVVSTTQKACRSLYEEHQLNYAVTANKETLQHYYESLVSLSVLQLGRFSPPPSPPATTDTKKKSPPSQGIVTYKVGELGQAKALERLDVLASQVQKFLWYPGVEAKGAVNADVVRERVLKVYRQLTQPSKI
ncbi:dihydroxyacetonephosphate acyltransferase (DAT) [Leptomonas pyrrhocoris]|uniref:Dihydroxyacetonephosphate acyltransferase (DAT) n=1 Tax=Leptomonas pyrrhocoris TaxID=157538 RepID=A0A0N1J504_LEPPY|nr:dihydroxyacetonephosphate acyltransferase (DAT) [Leptomonas pyrrhocoris]KPA82164.1 dihydroxyacetonephosphate acyltransferase (DAT) [Leptomonas pyrrhocoris]|eukprot:XP_015660603.1 dihydroxyacetonephosphate acyltransferase (DAT) [Leptomonas pyrrhocoris]